MEVLRLSSEKHDLPEQVQRELAVRTETVTPWYWALWVYVKYRSSKNYRSFDFLSARIFDKVRAFARLHEIQAVAAGMPV